jgi:hypothetical protein
MNARSFAWHDILTFYRYRQQLVCTDSAQALTHGSPVGPMALLARLNPSVGSYTGICYSANGNTPMVGHMRYPAGSRSARILFLMPEEGLNQPGLTDLLEHLAAQAGAWGAFHLLAEIDESSLALEGLRRSGFSVYAWQHIWKYTTSSENSSLNGSSNASARDGSAGWTPAASIDEIGIRNLYQSLVPPLVQSAEPLPAGRLAGWVYRQEGEILAYVEGVYGPQGTYMQPLIHPAVENVSQVLASLLVRQPTLLGRPVFLAIRSYQAWLETIVRDLEFQVAPRQALMVKHLVLHQRDVVPVRHAVLEKYSTEPTAPMIQNSTSTVSK